MRFTPALGIALLCWSNLAALKAETEIAPSAGPYVLKDTEIRVLPPTQPDRQYELIIGLPASFKTAPTKIYPVVFVTDGYWDFTTVWATVSNMVYGKNLPEMIVVGLAYAGDNPDVGALKQGDHGPVKAVGDTNPSHGHAAQYREMIEKAAIPLLEKDYRADPHHRYLMGCSSGGGFALFTLLTKPDLFQGYVADSPSTEALWQFESELAASGRLVEARVFMSATENESDAYRRDIIAFYDRLSKRNYLKGGVKFRLIDNMRHAGGKPECYTQGLMYVCAPIAPEAGISTNFYTDPQNRAHYLISYWAAGSVSAIELKPHEDYLAKAVAAKTLFEATATLNEVSQRFSNAILFAAERSDADAFAKSDPGVSSGLLKYEVITVPASSVPRSN